MRPDHQSNPQPFGYGTTLYPTEPPQPGLELPVDKGRVRADGPRSECVLRACGSTDASHPFRLRLPALLGGYRSLSPSRQACHSLAPLCCKRPVLSKRTTDLELGFQKSIEHVRVNGIPPRNLTKSSKPQRVSNNCTVTPVSSPCLDYRLSFALLASSHICSFLDLMFDVPQNKLQA